MRHYPDGFARTSGLVGDEEVLPTIPWAIVIENVGAAVLRDLQPRGKYFQATHRGTTGASNKHSIPRVEDRHLIDLVVPARRMSCAINVRKGDPLCHPSSLSAREGNVNIGLGAGSVYRTSRVPLDRVPEPS